MDTSGFTSNFSRPLLCTFWAKSKTWRWNRFKSNNFTQFYRSNWRKDTRNITKKREATKRSTMTKVRDNDRVAFHFQISRPYKIRWTNNWNTVLTTGGYHSEKKHGSKGEKGHKFEEKGGFKKGHSTKGKHEVHKLDEFEKKKKFFDEDGDSAFDEKHGSFHEESGYKKVSSQSGFLFAIFTYLTNFSRAEARSTEVKRVDTIPTLMERRSITRRVITPRITKDIKKKRVRTRKSFFEFFFYQFSFRFFFASLS